MSVLVGVFITPTNTPAGKETSVREIQKEDGASAVEYGLLIAGIAAIAFLSIFLFGGFVNQLFSDTCTTVNAEKVASGGASSQCQ